MYTHVKQQQEHYDTYKQMYLKLCLRKWLHRAKIYVTVSPLPVHLPNCTMELTVAHMHIILLVSLPKLAFCQNVKWKLCSKSGEDHSNTVSVLSINTRHMDANDPAFCLMLCIALDWQIWESHTTDYWTDDN